MERKMVLFLLCSVCSDMGTEMNSLEKNRLYMDHQQLIRSWQNSFCTCIMYFVYLFNILLIYQRIEAWWRQLKKNGAHWWTDFFKVSSSFDYHIIF